MCGYVENYQSPKVSEVDEPIVRERPGDEEINQRVQEQIRNNEGNRVPIPHQLFP